MKRIGVEKKKEGKELKPRNEPLKETAEYRNKLPLLSHAFNNNNAAEACVERQKFYNGQDQRKKEREREMYLSLAPNKYPSN